MFLWCPKARLRDLSSIIYYLKTLNYVLRDPLTPEGGVYFITHYNTLLPFPPPPNFLWKNGEQRNIEGGFNILHTKKKKNKPLQTGWGPPLIMKNPKVLCELKLWHTWGPLWHSLARRGLQWLSATLCSSSSRKVELSLIFFFSSSLLHLFLVRTPVHLLEPRSLTCIFLLQFFFRGSVPVIIIAIVAPAVMEKKINLGDCRHGTLRLFFEWRRLFLVVWFASAAELQPPVLQGAVLLPRHVWAPSRLPALAVES